MFIGPVELDAAWDPRSVGGVYRFLNRCYSLIVQGSANDSDSGPRPAGPSPRAAGANSRAAALRNAPSQELFASRNIRHKTIKKVTTDIYKHQFNTAVAGLMEYVNELYKLGATEEDLVVLAKLLKPFAPHLASEMLERLGVDDEWPKWDEEYLVADTVELVVQVNGKLRATMTVDVADLEDEQKIIDSALALDKIKRYTENGIKKTIFVKKAKLLNLVV